MLKFFEYVLFAGLFLWAFSFLVAAIAVIIGLADMTIRKFLKK
jgi:hypothetical protein